MIEAIKNFKLKHMKEPFYICEYSSNNESGEFACLGATYEEAVKDAIAHVKKIAITNGEFTVKVRKANFWQLLK